MIHEADSITTESHCQAETVIWADGVDVFESPFELFIVGKDVAVCAVDAVFAWSSEVWHEHRRSCEAGFDRDTEEGFDVS